MEKIFHNLPPLLGLRVLSGCATSQPHVTRYAWGTGLKSDKIGRYEYLHSHSWPAVNQMIKECRIRNYSIYEREIGGKTYLFSYLGYTSTNVDADMKKMAADGKTQRWWKKTDSCQQPLSDATAKGKIWSDCKEVFHLQ